MSETRTQAAKRLIIELFKQLETDGVEVEIASDYGADNCIVLSPRPWTGWQDVEEVRWYDY